VWCKTIGGSYDKKIDAENGRTTDGKECLAKKKRSLGQDQSEGRAEGRAERQPEGQPERRTKEQIKERIEKRTEKQAEKQPKKRTTNNCTGVSLYKKQGLKGDTLGWDFTTVPAVAECVDLNNVFGDFIDQTRSFKIPKQRKCWFYTYVRPC
jgi:hypothetical protein